MSFLDRDRNPVRFAVVTSVVSGAALASILALAGAVMRTGVLTWRVPIWSLIAVFVFSACLVAAAFAGRLRPAKRTFLIIPAFSQKHWISELIQNTHRALDRRGMDVLLKIPDKDYSATGQAHHLRHLLSRRAECVGGFIVPVELDRIRPDLVSFCGRFAKPVVLLDVEPFADERDYPPNTVFVGYDPVDIGARAANWVVGHLAARGETEPTIVVVGSQAQRARQQRFIEVVSGKMPRAHIVLHDDGHFARMRARKVVGRSLRQLRDDNRKPSVIFCTSDEMALGAVDALLADGSNVTHDVAVVGVDGTPEARALIDSGRSPLRATVVQDSYRISELAADLFERMVKGERVQIRNLLPAELYDGDHHATS
jgi:ribose transport system substrate-binding protein